MFLGTVHANVVFSNIDPTQTGVITIANSPYTGSSIAFTVPDTYTITEIRAPLRISSPLPAPANNFAIVRPTIHIDNGGIPGAQISAFNSRTFTPQTPLIVMTFIGSATLSPGQVYHVVFQREGGSANVVQAFSHTLTPSGTFSFVDSLILENGIWRSYGNIWQIELTTSTTPSEGDDPIVYPPDDRVNWQFGDLSVVAYSVNNDDGNEELHVYCWNGFTAWLAFAITSEELEGIETPPTNTLFIEEDENGCRVEFWLLSSGTYQLNIYTPDGKLYEIEDDDLDFRDADRRYFDPNEGQT